MDCDITLGSIRNVSPFPLIKPSLFQFTNVQGKSKARASNLLWQFWHIQNKPPGSVGHGALYLPENKPQKNLPTIVYVYGGPHVQVRIVDLFFNFKLEFLCINWTYFLWHVWQLLKNDFSMLKAQFSLWCFFGYCVVVVDNVGSARRGKKFESAVHLVRFCRFWGFFLWIICGVL